MSMVSSPRNLIRQPRQLEFSRRRKASPIWLLLPESERAAVIRMLARLLQNVGRARAAVGVGEESRDEEGRR